MTDAETLMARYEKQLKYNREYYAEQLKNNPEYKKKRAEYMVNYRKKQKEKKKQIDLKTE
jgi:hypothetical protein